MAKPGLKGPIATSFKKGVSGNPGGNVRSKIFRDELLSQLKQARLDGVKGTNLEGVIAKLIGCALDGNDWAVEMVAERIDGKVMQELAGVDGKAISVSINLG